MALVVAQLTEGLLPTPEIRGLSPNIGNKIFEQNYLSIAIRKKTKIKTKKPGMDQLKKE